ncbi:MAG TPA: zinc-binding alcohol dehydrogenase family protein, partial [Trueperaceae bacterium]|nr:zinc-binding alcohol dehydrogenase family protein [Trueperaceae bacterium]
SGVEAIDVRTVVLESPRTLTLTERPAPPAPAAGEATVRVLEVGVCGTDLHAFNGNQPMMRYPVVLGHELALEITALGPGTGSLGLDVGDRCTAIPYVDCGHCGACRRGKTNACQTLSVLGVHEDGGLRESFNLPARLLLEANDLDVDQLAMVEMLAIGEHAVARASITAEDSVLVIGAGPIGLGTIAAAGLRGPRVLALDLSAERRAFVASLGTADVLPPETATAPADVLRQRLAGELPTVVLDATGNANSMGAALSLVAPGGRLVLVGHTAQTLGFDNPTLHRGELTVLASRNATRHDFDNVLSNLRGGAIDVSKWITTRVDPGELVRELPRWAAGPTEVVKVVVEFA